VTLYSTLAGSRLVPLVLGLGGAGCVVVALALVFRVALLVPWGVALVGAAYAVFLRLRGGAVDSNAVYVAVGLVVTAEVAFLSLRPPVPAGDGRIQWDAALRIVVIAIATLLGGGIVLVASGASGGGLVLEGIGVAASVVIVSAVVTLAARARDSAST
jgi:hypothetical protein